LPLSLEAFTTRRQFLTLLGFVSALPAGRLLLSAGTPVPAAGQSPAIRNRAPLAPNAFYFLPQGSIHPSGWLRDQLRIQANGLSGHLDEAWTDVGPNSGWLGGTGESWEQGPYFLDGLVPLAYLLDDTTLKLKAQRFIDWTREHQATSRMIVPSSNDDWCHAL
jgi:hypothetical protein